MAGDYKYKQVKFDLKFNEKCLRQFSDRQRENFVKSGSNFLYTKKVWVSVGPDKDYSKKGKDPGLKVVFQFGKGKDEFAHVTIHNLTQKGALKVNRKVGKGNSSKKWNNWMIQDQVLVGRAKKWAKNFGFELS